MKTFCFTLLTLSLLPLTNGCSGKASLAHVKGTVTLDGKPLAKGTIIFETAGQRPATGRIENGEIVDVTCYKTGDGAPIGSHKVAISAAEEAASAVVENPGDAKAPGPNYMSGKSLIPSRYNDPSASGLTAVIKRGENVLEFKLTSD
jgi:hypothetical protein